MIALVIVISAVFLLSVTYVKGYADGQKDIKSDEAKRPPML